MDPTDAVVVVEHAGHIVARTTNAVRVLETSQPPGYYLPASDVNHSVLQRSDLVTMCEWKGLATYWHLVVPGAEPVADAAWSYPDPRPGFEAIADHLAFYPQRVNACWVNDEQVEPNEGSFYGGWITSAVVGPFKGGSGTMGW